MIFRKQRKQFLKDFGISINMPGNFLNINGLGYLITTTRFYPKDHQYFLSFEHFAFPEDTQVVSFTPTLHNTKKKAKEDNQLSNQKDLEGEEWKTDVDPGVKVVDEDNFMS